jgi:hypothetical protein
MRDSVWDRIERMRAALLENELPSTEDVAWARSEVAKRPGGSFVFDAALELGEDIFREILHRDTLKGGSIDQDGDFTVKYFTDEMPSEAARDVGNDSIETAYAVYKAKCDRIDNNRSNAAKPRPASRHSRREEAEAEGMKIAARNPSLSARRISELVSAKMDSADDPAPDSESIARWLRLILKKNRTV